MEALLNDWCEASAKNGISQHSLDWLANKVYTIGGSSLATVMGINAFSDIRNMMYQKVGITKFDSNIKPQWGNLFEEVIKRVVEIQQRTKVYGEDLYISGSTIEAKYMDTSYSPDGLAIIEMPMVSYEEEEVYVDGIMTECRLVPSKNPTYEKKCVLVEFKCPQSRLPRGYVPKYYVPQVKMGLELLKIADTGLFVEAVFRRCSWDQLDFTDARDITLVKPCGGTVPIMYGMIGLYMDKGTVLSHDLDLTYLSTYGEWSETEINDLGCCNPTLFEQIMHNVDAGRISAWYCDPIVATKNTPMDKFEAYLDEFTEATNGKILVGVLPWKLFRIDYHWINRTDDYLLPYMDLIHKIVANVKVAMATPDLEKRKEIVDDFLCTNMLH